MSDAFQKSLIGAFGKKPSEPAKPAPVPTPKPSSPQQEPPDLWVAAEAQRIFNPDAPPATNPEAKAPAKAMIGQGTAPAMGTEGPWGKPGA